MHDGETIRWVFGETQLVQHTYGEVITNSYTIDYLHDPILLDITVEYKIPTNSTIATSLGPMKCIMQFLDISRFRVVGEYMKSKPRPITFEGIENILIFTKEEE